MHSEIQETCNCSRCSSMGCNVRGMCSAWRGHMALESLERMEQEVISSNEITLISALKACLRTGALEECRSIHNRITSDGLELRPVLNALINMYAKFGRLHEASHVFNGLTKPNIMSWGAMVAGYAQQGDASLVLECFENMQREGMKLNKVIFLSVLKACARTGELKEGRFLHSRIIEAQYGFDVVLGSALIDMYAKCGSLEEACQIISTVPNCNVVSWNALISGCSQHGKGCRALEFFEKMQNEGTIPDETTFSCILKACSSIGQLEKGRLIHSDAIKRGLQIHVLIINALISMYAKCGSLMEALKAFSKLRNRNSMSWNAIISAYILHGDGIRALDCFEEMRSENMKSTQITFLNILKACGITGHIAGGRHIHEEILELGLPCADEIGSTLMDMYAKCGSLEDADRVFVNLSSRDVVSWNVIISGYAQHGNGSVALICFDKMQNENTKPNEVTLLGALKACLSMTTVTYGRLIHNRIIETGHIDVLIGNTLIDMYAKHGSIEEAHNVFDKMSVVDIASWNAKIAAYSQNGECLWALQTFEQMCQEGVMPNVVSWGSLITGYAQYGEASHALQFYKEMQQKGIEPDIVILLSVLKACTTMGALDHGRTVHEQIRKCRVQLDVVIGSVLLDMYAKCGSLQEARKMFEEQPNQDIVLWNAMIMGYSQHGECLLAFKCFENMQQGGIEPDENSFSHVLIACGHAGFLDEGWWYFKQMRRKHGIRPNVSHYIYIIDILGRLGFLSMAEEFLRANIEISTMAWISLVRSCRIHGNVELGRSCFEKIICLDSSCAAGYVIMSNAYADAYAGKNKKVQCT